MRKWTVRACVSSLADYQSPGGFRGYGDVYTTVVEAPTMREAARRFVAQARRLAPKRCELIQQSCIDVEDAAGRIWRYYVLGYDGEGGAYRKE
jgi:hypothetical protein